DGVVNGRAAAGASFVDLVPQQAAIAGESLDHLRLIVESHGEGLVFSAAQDAIEKVHRRFLLKLDAVTNAVRGIEQHAYPEGKVRLLAEKAYLLKGVVVGDLEVAFFEVRNKLVAAIEHGCQHVHQVYFGSKG